MNWASLVIKLTNIKAMLVANEEATSQLFAKHFDIIPLIIFQEVQTQIRKAIDVF